MEQLTILYRFTLEDVKPLVDVQKVLRDRTLVIWEQKLVAGELMQKKEEPRLEIKKTNEKREAKVGRKNLEQEMIETYSISYYNPVLKKNEIIETSTTILMEDLVKQKIEESTGMQSTYPLYSFIITPVVLKEINPIILEDILQNREYDTPPPSSGASVIKVAPQQNVVKLQLVEEKKIDEVKGALIEVIKRKEGTEKRISKEIVLLEHVTENIKKGKDIRSTIQQLGPITKARFLAALKKRGISKSIILLLLEKDILFLKSIKKKIELLSVDDLINLIKTIRFLQKKK